jgi:hypothetical protein
MVPAPGHKISMRLKHGTINLNCGQHVNGMASSNFSVEESLKPPFWQGKYGHCCRDEEGVILVDIMPQG